VHARKIITLALALSIAPPVVSFADAAVALPTKAAAPKTERRAKRLTLVGIENGVRFVAQTQPKEIKVDKLVPWKKARSSTGDRPELEFTSAEGRTMSFELTFDTSDTNQDVHEVWVAKLLSLAMVMATDASASEEKKRPPRVKVLGIGSIAFEGVIESIAVRYTTFTGDGVPVRATCTVKLEEASRASFRRG
jgi:hypothetical protein